MKKRTALLKVLKNRFATFINSPAFLVTTWIVFAIIGAIIGFNSSKIEPIPFTQDEIEYYTEQAELAYNKGLKYLDNNIIFIPIDNTTFKVYTDGQPAEKQKLKVTYSDKEIINSEPYYSYPFLGTRIACTIISAFIGAVVFIPIFSFVEWIIKKMVSIKEDVAYELKKENSVTDKED